MPSFFSKVVRKLESFANNRWPSYSLLYHLVSNDDSNPLVSNNIHKVSPENFYTQISQIKQAYKIITIDELVERIKKKKRITHTCSITFDDGYKSVLTNALPVLDALEVPATFFICTSLITERIFWRDKVRLLISKGCVQDFLRYARLRSESFNKLDTESFYHQSKDPAIIDSSIVAFYLDKFCTDRNINLTTISSSLYAREEDLIHHKFLQYGNHTVNHFVMASLPIEKQANEIKEGEAFLRKLNLTVSSCFSIPFGGPISYNWDTLRLASDFSYKGCLLSSGFRQSAVHVRLPVFPNTIDTCLVNRFMPKNSFQAIL